MLFLIICSVLGLWASEREALRSVPFEYKFCDTVEENSVQRFAGTLCVLGNKQESLFVSMMHSEPEGVGEVRILGKKGEHFEIKTRFPTMVIEDGQTSIEYYNGETFARAKVEDFVPVTSNKPQVCTRLYREPFVCAKVEGLTPVIDHKFLAQVVFMPPAALPFGWLPNIGCSSIRCCSLRPRIYWMCGCNDTCLTFTRILFLSTKVCYAYFFSVEVMLNTLSRGKVSWGTMSLVNTDERTVVESRDFDYSRNLLWT